MSERIDDTKKTSTAKKAGDEEDTAMTIGTGGIAIMESSESTWEDDFPLTASSSRDDHDDDHDDDDDDGGGGGISKTKRETKATIQSPRKVSLPHRQHVRTTRPSSSSSLLSHNPGSSLHSSSNHSVASSLGGNSSHHPNNNNMKNSIHSAAGSADGNGASRGGAGGGPYSSSSSSHVIPSTPVSARSTTSKKRLSNKLAERFSKFEGGNNNNNNNNGLQSPSFSVIEGGSDTELSPLHTDSPKVPLSETGRKRNIRSSLAGRVKVFDSPKQQVAKLLLSPQEVRQMVLSTTTNTRLHGIVHQYEHLSEQDQRQRLADRANAKERQRLLLLNDTQKERRQQWEQAKAQFNERHQKLPMLSSPDLVFQEVRAPLSPFQELQDFVPPNYGIKTYHQRQLILKVMERNFCFAEFRHLGKARTEGTIEAFIQAFEVIPLDVGHVLWHQGILKHINKNASSPSPSSPSQMQSQQQTHAFYIIEQGLMEFHADGVKVGTAHSDDWFGEQALLYPSPSPVTVSVGLDSDHQQAKNNNNNNNNRKGGSGENTTTTTSTTTTTTGAAAAQLLKLDPRSYRGLVHCFSEKATNEKRQMLRQIDFLQELFSQEQEQEQKQESSNDVDLIRRLAWIMKRIEYNKGDVFNDAAEDVTFIIVQSGSLSVASSNGALELTLHAGDYFGERALIGTLPRKSMVTSSKTTMTATTDGVLFQIDRCRMEAIMGPKRLVNLQDMHRVSRLPLVRRAKLSAPAKSKAANRFIEHRCSGNKDDDTVILNVKSKDSPALYVVREGTVNVTYSGKIRKDQTLKQGEVFGHDQLEETNDDNGQSTIRRTGGFQATTADGKAATVGVLHVKDLGLEPSSSQHSIKSPISSDSPQTPKPSKATRSTLALRNKLRQAVQDGVGLDDLEKLTLLGEGEFGEVWLVAADLFKTGDPNLRQKFALKSQLKVDETRGKDAVDAIRREIQVMREIDHPQIVDLVQTYEDDTHLYMLMGLIPGGELWDRIYQELPNGDWTTGLSEKDAKFYTLVIADTLDYMHRQQYIFRDLKPENIMIDSDGYPVLVDFGFAKFCPDRTYTFCGTPNYVSPEVITHSGHNRCVDHWALGITLYEMITGENPFYFEGLDPTALYDAICREPHYPLSKEDGRTDELMDLVDQLLEKDPTKRIGMLAGGMTDILKHPWFEGIDLVRIRAKKWPAPWKPESAEDSSISDGLIEKMGLNIPMPAFDDSSQSFNDSFASIAEEVEKEAEEEADEPLKGDKEVKADSRHSHRKNNSSDDDDGKIQTEKKKKSGTKKKKTKKVSKSDFRFVTPTEERSFDPVSDPRKKISKSQREQSKSRRSAISDTLAGLGLDSDDDYPLF